MLRFEPARVQEHGGWVDSLGYARCIPCHGERQGAQWSAANSLPGDCDGCGKAWRDCPPLVIEGTAALEFVKCKIF